MSRLTGQHEAPPPDSAGARTVSDRHTRKPLPWRAEARRQLSRRRTLWAFGILLALPLVMVGAFAIGGGGGGSQDQNGTTGFVDLATSGSANFTVFTIFVSANLLLLILAALFVGDSIPAEASWSSLRYLLIAPVPRARLLTSKLVVGLASTALAVLLLPGWSLLVGGLFYGWSPFGNPAGGGLAWSLFLPRLLMVMAYLFVSVLQVASIAFAIGVVTDAPLAAVGGAVLLVIVSSILDAIDTLGSLRHGLPMHYSQAWLDLLAPQVQWDNLRHGVLWSLLWTALLLVFAYRHFGRKDIQS